MTVEELIEKILPFLTQGPGDNPLREARLLIAHALGKTYEEIFFNPGLSITPVQRHEIHNWVMLRMAHVPIAKIIGAKEFWGLIFKVTRDTLDPRPDSETLIETVLDLIPDRSRELKILDLGTGTGCLLLSLLHEYPNAIGIGVDASAPALQVALENAKTLNLDGRCELRLAHWFDGLDSQTPFDVIISNPPYIAEGTQLSKETLHDPNQALFGGKDGLEDYRTILSQARGYMGDKSLFVLEIGFDQEEKVIEIAHKHSLSHQRTAQDLEGHPRCLVFCKLRT